MAEVTARKRGKSWEYRFEGASINGKRKQYSKSGFKTKKEALVEGTKKYNLFNQTGSVFEPKDISFSDFLDYFYKNYVQRETKPKTQHLYKCCIDAIIKPGLGAYKLQAITSIACQEWLNSLNDKGLAQASIRRYQSTLKKALDYAVTPCNFIQVNPMRLVYSPKPKNPTSKKAKYVTTEQFEKILEATNNRKDYQRLFILAWTLGLRASEVCGLTWDHIDFENSNARIDRQLLYLNKALTINTPKTSSSNRTISFGSNFRNYLLKLKEEQEDDMSFYQEYYTRYYLEEDGENVVESMITQSLPELCFVCRKDNGKAYNVDAIDRYCKRVSEKVGFKFTFHWLRHSNATYLLDAGLEIKEVQKRLGHADINTTYNTYIHNTQQMIDNGAKLSDTLLKLPTN